MLSPMPDAWVKEQGTVFRSQFLYASHPHIGVSTSGEILVVFNLTQRSKFVFHPPHDPEYRNWTTRSQDLGRSWSRPQVIPDYRYSGTECAGLTVLSTGRVLLNQWRNRWYPLGLARAEALEPMTFPDEFANELILSAELETGHQIADTPENYAPWARGHGTSYVHISEDGGRSFTKTTVLDTGAFHGGYGLRGAVELPDGMLLLPLNDIPEFCTIFTLCSRDGGLTWADPVLIAQLEGRLFTEPAMLLMTSGELLCMMRDDTTRIMHVCRSSDAGQSWTSPEPTGIDGYPPHLILLSDGRLLCTYGMRRPEYSIRAVYSEDRGRSWSTSDPIMIRRRLPNGDLGYPSTAALSNGELLTVYYCQDKEGVTGIEYTRWKF